MDGTSGQGKGKGNGGKDECRSKGTFGSRGGRQKTTKGEYVEEERVRVAPSMEASGAYVHQKKSDNARKDSTAKRRKIH